MQVKLCKIPIQLNTVTPAIQSDWNDIFVLHKLQKGTDQPKIFITAYPIDLAPPINENDITSTFKSPNGSYSLASTADGRSMLTLASGAIICLPNLNQPFDLAKPISAEMFVSQEIIEKGQIEDVTFTLLAPLLRRFGIFIVHAFGAVHPTKPIAALIIGRSGQGKTTTGLALIKEGWRFLGNDAILLSKNDHNQIIAWPSPGKINLHPYSLTILGNSAFFPSDLKIGSDGKYHFPAETLVHQPTPHTFVNFQLFPQISNRQGACQFKKMSNTIALSRTMEQSVDHWDSQTLTQHFVFLEQLVSQAQSFQVTNTITLANYGEQLMAHSKAK